MTYKTQKMINLHLLGYSTRRIAELFGMKKNTVLSVLKYHRVLRKNLGYDIERAVERWMKHAGHNVERMPGDAPYDLLIDGVKTDVKSAVRSRGSFKFELQHKETIKRKTSRDVDALILVFKEKSYSMYGVVFKEVQHLDSMCMVDPENTKYNLFYLGDLKN